MTRLGPTPASPTILRGVPDIHVADRLRDQAERYLERRRSQDRAFAAVLEPVARGRELPETAHDGSVYYLEHVLEHVVFPLMRSVSDPSSDLPTGVLILLLNGMDGSTTTQVVSGIQGMYRAWTELVPAGTIRRPTALALLPSLTTHSRTSFFSGRPVNGGQDAEKAEFIGRRRKGRLRRSVTVPQG